jgi:hypothetical protein
MIYLVLAYVFGVALLGGFLALSLGHLRDLTVRAPAKK